MERDRHIRRVRKLIENLVKLDQELDAFFNEIPLRQRRSPWVVLGQGSLRTPPRTSILRRNNGRH